jgi:hypothetical protein
MRYVLGRQVNSLAKLRGYFFLSSLGEGVLGGRLMLGYQKSLPAQYTLTQTANSSFGSRKFPAC